jgi:hypothetical protein
MTNSPDRPLDNQTVKHAPGLSPMEMMGVLMVRMIHDLSNQLTILAGNAQVLDMVRNNPERLAKVIDRIKTSSTNVGNLIERFARFRQDYRYRAAPHALKECVREVEALNPFSPGWTVELAGELNGQIALEPRWVAYAVWQVALLGGGGAGSLRVSAGGFPADWDAPAYVPSRLREQKVLQCELRWQGPGPWLEEKEAAKPSDLNLATAYEILKIIDGWAHYKFVPDEQHRFNLFFPLST